MKKIIMLSLVMLSIFLESYSQNMPIVGKWYLEEDNDGETRLTCAFSFTNDVYATIICSNASTQETYYYAKNYLFKAFKTYQIGYPHTKDWYWQPGEKLTIKASGYLDFVFQIPYAGTAQWNRFVADMTQPTYQTPSYPTYPTYETAPSYQQTERVCSHCKGTRIDPYAYHTAPHYTSDRSCCSIPKDQPGSCKTSKICQVCFGTGKAR